jgi:hypothetical protein
MHVKERLSTYEGSRGEGVKFIFIHFSFSLPSDTLKHVLIAQTESGRKN